MKKGGNLSLTTGLRLKSRQLSRLIKWKLAIVCFHFTITPHNTSSCIIWAKYKENRIKNCYGSILILNLNITQLPIAWFFNENVRRFFLSLGVMCVVGVYRYNDQGPSKTKVVDFKKTRSPENDYGVFFSNNHTAIGCCILDIRGKHFCIDF